MKELTLEEIKEEAYSTNNCGWCKNQIRALLSEIARLNGELASIESTEDIIKRLDNS